MDLFTGSPANVSGIQSFVSSFNNFSARPAYSGANPRFLVRLVEFKPAWALHALLRFRGITYLNENLPIPASMGQTLPLVVDGQYIMGESDAMAYYGREGTSVDEIESIHGSELTTKINTLGKLLRLIKCRNGREDMAEIKRACGPYCPTSWEAQIRDLMDRTFSRDSIGDEDLLSLDTQGIIERLRALLSEFESYLVKNDGYLFGRSPSKASGGGDGRRQPIPRSHVAEALLFGHICDLLCCSVSSEVDEIEYPQIMAFVTSIFEDYFEMTTVPPSIELDSSLQNNRDAKRKKVIEWRRSSDLLLQNSFVATLPPGCIVPSLLKQKTKYTSLDERSERAWRRLMALRTEPDSSPENDSTASRWTTIRFSVDSLVARLLRRAGKQSGTDEDTAQDEEARARDKEGVVTVYLGGAMFLTAVGLSFVGYLAVAGGYSQGIRVPSRLGGR
jgi:hypothetical protein